MIYNGVKKLEGKIALVTGASRGIGRATALKLSELGASVVVNYLTQHQKAEETVAEIKKRGGNSLAFSADISSEEKIKEMVLRVEEKMGIITILVNNASPEFRIETLEDASWNSFETHLEVQLRGAFQAIRATLSGMKKERYGKIVNVLSSYVLLNFPAKAAPYVVAKEALWGLTKVAAADLASYGIRVNAVSPGLTDAGGTDRVFPPRYKELAAQKSPLGRITAPEDVANIIAFLAGPESDHMTGLNIPVGIVV